MRLFWLCFLLTPLAAEETVNVPIGITDLLDDPACTVGFQRDGEEPRELGWRWTGFDAGSGVYFQPEARDGDRRPYFFHSPWRPGPGKAFADFRLKLPQTSPLKLEISTHLRASSAGDGVQYSVLVDGQELWTEFGAWRQWQDNEVDLTPFAGREVTLRLQVDPGPKRESKDDWALWGRATILAGSERELAAARARAARAEAAERHRELLAGSARAEANLAAFASREVTSARPSTAGPVENSLARDGAAYLLQAKARDETITYRFDPSQGLLDGLTVSIDGKALDPQPFKGSATMLFGTQSRSSQATDVKRTLLSAEVQDGAAVCRYAYRLPGAEAELKLTARLAVEGKSLALRLEGDGPITTFAVRTDGGPRLTTPFGVGPVVQHRQGCFVGAFADLWQSDASSVGGASAQVFYRHLTDGSYRPLRDTFYLTVSSRFEECLANVAHRPSPFLADLSQRVVLDLWGGNFADDQVFLDDLARYGVTNCLIIKHVWQRDGYDRTYPNVFPANAKMGGDAALRSLVQRAKAIGHEYSVHENFYDYYPNAEDFQPEDCAVDPDGQDQVGWDRGPIAAKILKPTKLMEYARRFSPEVVKRYGCDASYHDIMPTWRVDFDAKASGSGMIRTTHRFSKELFDFDRELYGGPVVCEAMGGVTAGLFDGGCNHGRDTYQTPVAPVFELLKIHPKMSNHGFGYYERWLPWGYGPGWNTYVMTDRELDRYRAVTVAYGRTGFIGQQLRGHPHALVREYHLMQAFGRAYTGRELRGLAYFVEDGDWSGWVDAATAMRLNRLERSRATYEDGQRVYVNLADQPWSVEGGTLPPDGSLTLGPRAEAGTTLIDGQIADRAAYDGTQYVDARSQVWQPSTNVPAPITPRAVGFKDLGGGKFQVSVEFDVQRKLDRDYLTFWHFLTDQGIRFQSDHKLPQPPTSWQVGSKVIDGPRTIQVPLDQTQGEYEFGVGLYDQQGRAPLVLGRDTVKLGVLKVDRKNGRVTGLSFVETAPDAQPGTMPEPYLEGANREKKILDFGEVATNGAVVVKQLDGTREVTPVPYGDPMSVGLGGQVKAAEAFGLDGKSQGELKLSRRGDKTWFELTATVAKVVAK